MLFKVVVSVFFYYSGLKWVNFMIFRYGKPLNHFIRNELFCHIQWTLFTMAAYFDVKLNLLL